MSITASLIREAGNIATIIRHRFGPDVHPIAVVVEGDEKKIPMYGDVIMYCHDIDKREPVVDIMHDDRDGMLLDCLAEEVTFQLKKLRLQSEA